MFQALLICLLCIALPAQSTEIQVDLDTLQPRLYVDAFGPAQTVAEYEFDLNTTRGPIELTLKGGLRPTSPLAAQLICDGLVVESTSLLWSQKDTVYLELRFAPNANEVLSVIPRGIVDWKENWERRNPPWWNSDSGYTVIPEEGDFMGRQGSTQRAKKVLLNPAPELPTSVTSLEDSVVLRALFSWIDRKTLDSDLKRVRFQIRSKKKGPIHVRYRCATTTMYRKDTDYIMTYDISAGKIHKIQDSEILGDTTVSVSGLKLCNHPLQENAIPPLSLAGMSRFGRWLNPQEFGAYWGKLMPEFDDSAFRITDKNFTPALTVPIAVKSSKTTWTVRPVVGYFHITPLQGPTPDAFGCYLTAEPDIDLAYPLVEVPLPPIDWYKFVETYPAFPLDASEGWRGSILIPCYEGSTHHVCRIGGLKDLEVSRQVTRVERSGKTVHVLTLDFVSTSNREYSFTWRERQEGTSWVVLDASNHWAKRADNHALDIEVTVAPHSTASVRMELGTQ